MNNNKNLARIIWKEITILLMTGKMHRKEITYNKKNKEKQVKQTIEIIMSIVEKLEVYHLKTRKFIIKKIIKKKI